MGDLLILTNRQLFDLHVKQCSGCRMDPPELCYIGQAYYDALPKKATGRDPKQDPVRGDMLMSPGGLAITVLGSPGPHTVRYSQAQIPYMTTVTLVRWRHLVRNYEIKHAVP